MQSAKLFNVQTYSKCKIIQSAKSCKVKQFGKSWRVEKLFSVENYAMHKSNTEFWTLYSFALCKVWHFAQFCTLANFQIDLAHVWTDFQTCLNDIIQFGLFLD